MVLIPSISGDPKIVLSVSRNGSEGTRPDRDVSADTEGLDTRGHPFLQIVTTR